MPWTFEPAGYVKRIVTRTVTLFPVTSASPKFVWNVAGRFVITAAVVVSSSEPIARRPPFFSAVETARVGVPLP